MRFEATATRLWKRLTRQERLVAASSFFEQPDRDLLGSAEVAISKARRLRPQVARALPADEKARVLASLLEPGEALAAALLVSLHLGERRAMLVTFLEALRLPHEHGVLKDEADTAAPPGDDAAHDAVAVLYEKFDRSEVLTYLNALWLQDPLRWGMLEKAAARLA